MSRSPTPRPSQGSPWMPATAGTITIIVGFVQILFGLLLIGAGAELAERSGLEGRGLIGVPFAILGIIAVAGGVFAAVRRVWPLALIGAIAGVAMPIVWLLRDAIVRGGSVRAGTIVFLLFLIICGLSAVILLAIGRRDFK